MKEILKKAGGHLPPPDTAENIQAYLKWDDWRVLGAIVEGQAREHGEILRNRNHYRLVYWTPEVPSIEELEELERLQSSMDGLGAVMREAGKSWYKFEKEEIWVRSSAGSGVDKPIQLSWLSPVVKGLETVRQGRIYVPLANRKEAEQRIRASSGGGKEL